MKIILERTCLPLHTLNVRYTDPLWYLGKGSGEGISAESGWGHLLPSIMTTLFAEMCIDCVVIYWVVIVGT